MSGFVLDEIRIVDLSEVMQAPLATQILADFGATVIKIEQPGRGDITRSLDPEASADGVVSPYFAALNRHKRSVCLDLKDSQDLESLMALVAESDVIVNNYRPGVMERLGLGPATLRAVNPRLVYATAYGFGPSGPLSHKPGQDLVAQSISGIAMQRAAGMAEPYLHPIPFIDYASGMSLAHAITLALFERERSGEGQEVSISLYDTSIAIQTLEASSRLMYDRVTNWAADHFPNQPFRTSDGWIAVVGFFRPNPLQLVCRALELDDLSDDPRFATAELQARERVQLNALLAGEFVKLSTDDCLKRLEAQDILCAPILDLGDVLEHEQTAVNGILTSVDVPGQGELRTVGNPLRLSRTPAQTRGTVPDLGQHTTEVMEAVTARRSTDSGTRGQMAAPHEAPTEMRME